MVLFWIIVLVLIFWILIETEKAKKRREEERKQFLRDKYKDQEIVDKIINKTIWQGESGEQIIDSLGNPLDIDTKVLKTKKKEVWKYRRLGTNRYGLRVILENDVVVGWDIK